MATKNEEILRKPDWLKIKLNTNENYTGLKKMMREKNLHTVCEEAKCPNIHRSPGHPGDLQPECRSPVHAADNCKP